MKHFITCSFKFRNHAKLDRFVGHENTLLETKHGQLEKRIWDKRFEKHSVISQEKREYDEYLVMHSLRIKLDDKIFDILFEFSLFF